MNDGSFSRRFPACLRAFAGVLILAGGLCSVAASAETTAEFAARIRKIGGVDAVVNLRDDSSLGSIAIALAPQLVEDRRALEAALAEVGRFAASQRMRATVLAATGADGEVITGGLKAAGVVSIKMSVMADMVSNKTSRVFLLPATP